jgi:hypothetical protein
MVDEVTPPEAAVETVEPLGGQPDGTEAVNVTPPTEVNPVEEPAEEPALKPKETPAEDLPAEEPAKEPAADLSAWGDTGSEVGNSVLGMLQDSGIAVDDAKALLFDAVQAGDITKIDVAALTEKVGKHAANIIMSGTKSYISENKSKSDGIMTDVYAHAGGEENWTKASKWASENVPEADLAQYRPMLDKGGASARFVVSEVLAAYNKSEDNTTITPTTPRAEGDLGVPPAREATTRAQYVKDLEKANKNKASPREMAAIQAARNLGRKQGI